MLNKENETASVGSEVPVRHIVSFMFVSDIKDDQIAIVESAFRALQTKIAEVVSIESSQNINPEKLDQGYTRTWVVTFKSIADRDVYLIHPEHERFKKIAARFIAKAFVYDIQDESAKHPPLLADNIYLLCDSVSNDGNLDQHRSNIQAAFDGAFLNHAVDFDSLVGRANQWLPQLSSPYRLSLGAEQQNCYATSAGWQCDYTYELTRQKVVNDSTVFQDSIAVSYSTLDDSD